MKIGLITGNNLRHNALGSYLNQSGYEVIQVSEINESNKSTDSVFENYFKSVQKAEATLFDSKEWQQHIEDKITLKKGELNSIPNSINPLFSCDFVIVYGSSFIKGELYDLLSKKNTIKNFILDTSRGIIYSDDGSLLATTTPRYEIRWDSKVPSESNFQEKKVNLSKGLSKVLGKKFQYYLDILNNARKQGNRYLFS